jgi:hypothetical protein
MSDDSLPLYSNTCGKLYADKIIFASALRETAFTPAEIKGISLQRHIRSSSLFFIALPCILFFLPYFLSDEEHGLRVMLVLAGALMLLMSVYKAEKVYSLKLSLTNGRVITWQIWKGNITDAKKFIKNVRASLKHAKPV